MSRMAAPELAMSGASCVTPLAVTSGQEIGVKNPQRASAVATGNSTPMRPKPGNFTPGCRRSSPATSPSRLRLDALDPAELHREQNQPRLSLDAGAAVGAPGIKPGHGNREPTKFGGSATPSSGSARRIAAVKLLLFGPGQTQ